MNPYQEAFVQQNSQLKKKKNIKIKIYSLRAVMMSDFHPVTIVAK